ncbi:MAG: TatD family hydrolase [Subdoligranulum sp.]|nr:TatD family hydrolase [Subdoligranulum sp.]
MIFDTHAHYTSRRFDGHRDALLDSLPGQGVAGVVECGVDLATSRKALSLSKTRPWIFAAAGIHPESLIEEDTSTQTEFGGDWRAELAAIEPLFEDARVVAVGEIGLDHHWPVPAEAQLELFEAQLCLAREHKLPVLVHDREAHAETYALIKKYRPKGILHAFSGSADDALWIARQGMLLGFGGALTFKNARRAVEAAAALPMECIVLETDCPYMAPEPLRGKECNSAMIRYTAEKLAQIKNISVEKVLQITEQNARDLFGV